jgi:subtilisin-like proprotein convertase family protein
VAHYALKRDEFMKETRPMPERDWPRLGERLVVLKLLCVSCRLLCVGLLQPGLVQANTFQGTNSAQITINDAVADNQGNVTFTAATPYPSTIAVSGLAGGVSHVSVTLMGLYHTSCGDISMLLVAPDGTNCVVLTSEAGGYDIDNPPIGTVSVCELTFDDAATANLYTIGKWWAITNGTYQPTDAASSNFFLLPAPPGKYSSVYSNYNTRLSGLNGAAPNGDWSLYVQDESPGDTGLITNGWSLSLTTAPFYDGVNLTDPAQALADYDGDGLSNLMEYALGTDPHNPADGNAGMSVAITNYAGNRYLSVQYRRRTATPGLLLQYILEVSGDNVTWYSDSANVLPVSTNALDANFDMVTERDQTSTTAAAPRFIRLRVVEQ